ncbi:MAG: toll/interleukin-1 receptor domain-containing protein [Anaerolineae bacterium]|jgi:hypothetical protein|nr:toll/interleukin-1 receptor domain-containing protein [Anaerolineae bacterium]
MENPIDNPRNPKATLQEDVEDFVHDLAYGVVKLDWGFEHRGTTNILPYWASLTLMDISGEKLKFRNKWGNNAPHVEILLAYAYLKQIPSTKTANTIPEYRLTSKAFDLLDKPAKRIRIFISYKRNRSSALALLLEARLRLRGVREDHIFIDKSIAVGEKWEERIKSEVAACDYFVALIAPNTLDSINVRNEIDWALSGQKICHPYLSWRRDGGCFT